MKLCSGRPVAVDAEPLLSFVWLRDVVTNEPLVSGQQLAAASEEDPSGRAIVPTTPSEFDSTTGFLCNER